MESDVPLVPILPITPRANRIADGLHFATPVAMRIASIRCSDDEPNWNVSSLDSMLRLELDKAVIPSQSSIPNIVFPDNLLPFQVDQTLLDKLKINYNGYHWISQPKSEASETSEAKYAQWLNGIAAELKDVTGHQPRRTWNNRFSTIPLPGVASRRKPDLILIKPNDPETWVNVATVCEVTSEANFPPRIRNTVRQKAFFAFCTQPDRRFFPSIAFSQNEFIFSTFDRAGMVSTGPLTPDINALSFLRIVVGFMFGPDDLIGFDPTMIRSSDGSGAVQKIIVKGVDYTVKECIFSSETVRGRATRCWRVSKDGKQYVIKDSWCLRSRKPEPVVLTKVAGVEGVPRLLDWEDIACHGEIDSTAARRVGLSYAEERVHRRLVMEPIAKPLSEFESKKELIQAFADIVKTHQVLCEQKHILHRDISLNNLMLYDRNPNDKTRRGMIIDFDYSSEIGDKGIPSDNHRTGTGPYMAIEVLTNADHSSIVQKPKHDLESIFYVLLCFCFRYSGPRGIMAEYQEELSLDRWYFANQSYDSLATWKSGTLYEFENRVMRFLPPYFDNLKSCLYQLFDCVFTPHTYTTPEGKTHLLRAFNDNDATHAPMLKILEDMVTNLPDDDQWSPASRPMRASVPSSRRHVFFGFDNKRTSRDRSSRKGSGRKDGGVSQASVQLSIGQDSGDAGPSGAGSHSDNQGGEPVIGQSGATGKRRSVDPVTVTPSGGTAASTSSTSKKRRL